MKPILYYTITSRQFSGLKVFGVTSETRYGRINGRWVDTDEPSHIGRYARKHGKFDKAETAQEFVKKIAAVQAAAAMETRQLYEQAAKIDKRADGEIEAILREARS